MSIEFDIVEHVGCQLTNDSVELSLVAFPGGKKWEIVGSTFTTSRLVEDGAVVYWVGRKRYTEEKARALFSKVVEAFRAGDLSGLRKLNKHTGRNDDYICWALGLISESEALQIKRHNDQQRALWRDFDAGRLSEEEYRRLSDELSESIKPQ